VHVQALGLHAGEVLAERLEDRGRADVLALVAAPRLVVREVPDDLGMPFRGELVHIGRLEGIEAALNDLLVLC
jgi:hypothetical protein